MYKRVLLLILLLGLVVSPAPAYAELSYYNCANTTVSTHYNYVWVVDTERNHTTETWCEYDCSATTGECNADPSDVGFGHLVLVLGTFFVIFVFIYLGTNMEEERWVLQLLYLVLALLFTLANVFIVLQVSSYINTSEITTVLEILYMAVIVTTIITMLYYIVAIIIKVFSVMANRDLS